MRNNFKYVRIFLIRLHPGQLSSFIPIVFGGTNITRALDSLAICSTSVYHRMPMMDVIPRPPGFPHSSVYDQKGFDEDLDLTQTSNILYGRHYISERLVYV